MADRVQITGLDTIQQNLLAWERKIYWVIKQVGLFWERVFETYAKANYPWDDRTGNAAQSLHAFVEELSSNTVRVWLSHGVDYGIFLETKYAARYAIIWPTIEAHLQQVDKMLKEIFWYGR